MKKIVRRFTDVLISMKTGISQNLIFNVQKELFSTKRLGNYRLKINLNTNTVRFKITQLKVGLFYPIIFIL